MEKWLSWAVWPVLLVAAVLAARYLVSASMQIAHILAPGIVLGGPVAEQIFRVIVLAVSLAIFAGLPLLVAGIRTTRSLLGVARLPSWQDIGLSAAGFVVYLVCAMVLLAVMQGLSLIDVSQPQAVVSTSVYGADRVAVFVALVVAVPLVEELLFRGLLYGRLREARMTLWPAAVLVSLVFGALHGQWNVGIDVFCLSMVMVYLREKTGSIWPGFLMHMVKNMVAYYLMFGAR